MLSLKALKNIPSLLEQNLPFAIVQCKQNCIENDAGYAEKSNFGAFIFACLFCYFCLSKCSPF